MDFPPSEVRLLFVIEAVHRLGSLTAAARSLHLTQPALSHALGRMRSVFGDPLFVRTPRGMRPTPRCEELAGSARRILATIRHELGASAPFDPGTLERLVTFSMSDVGEMVLLPSLLDRIRTDSPRVNVATATMTPRELVDRLEDGSVDLALGYFPDLKGAGLARQQLFERDFRCVCAEDHPRIRGRRLSLSRFLAEPHLVVRSEGRVEEMFETFLKRLGHTRRVLMSVPHMLCVPAVIRRSDLVVTVPYSVAEALANYPGLRVLAPPLETPRIPVTQIWHRRFDEDPVNRWLRSLVAELFAGK